MDWVESKRRESRLFVHSRSPLTHAKERELRVSSCFFPLLLFRIYLLKKKYPQENTRSQGLTRQCSFLHRMFLAHLEAEPWSHRYIRQSIILDKQSFLELTTLIFPLWLLHLRFRVCQDTYYSNNLMVYKILLSLPFRSLFFNVDPFMILHIYTRWLHIFPAFLFPNLPSLFTLFSIIWVIRRKNQLLYCLRD